MNATTNVLLIDDDLKVRQALGAALRMENYSVVSASNGREAMRIFLQTKIHIVLLDLDLGLESGWDIFQSFIGIDPLIPLIIITAEMEPKQPFRGRPANAWMQKPLDLPLLFQLMKTAVANASENPECLQSVNQPATF